MGFEQSTFWLLANPHNLLSHTCRRWSEILTFCPLCLHLSLITVVLVRPRCSQMTLLYFKIIVARLFERISSIYCYKIHFMAKLDPVNLFTLPPQVHTDYGLTGPSAGARTRDLLTASGQDRPVITAPLQLLTLHKQFSEFSSFFFPMTFIIITYIQIFIMFMRKLITIRGSDSYRYGHYR